MATSSESPAMETSPQESSANDCSATPPQASWFSRHRMLVDASAALLLLAILLLVILPLGVSLMRTPQYRASAWFRVEYVPENYVGEHVGHAEHSGDIPPAVKAKKEKPQPPGQGASEQQQQPLHAPIGQLYTRQIPKEVEQELLKARTQALEEQLQRRKIEIDEDTLDFETLKNPNVMQLTKDFEALQKTQQEHLMAAGGDEQNAQYLDAKKLAEELGQRRSQEFHRVREEIRSEKITAKENKRAEILKRAKERIARNQLEIDLLRRKFVEQRGGALKSPESMDPRTWERDLRNEQAIVELLTSRILRMRTETTGPASVTLLRKAEPPTEPINGGWFSFWNSDEQRETEEVLLEDSYEISRSKQFLAEQVKLIKSSYVLEPLLSQPDIVKYKPLAESPDSVQWLAERTHVQSQANSELFIINFTCDDPKYAALIANAIVESYFRIRIQIEAQPSTRVVDLLEDERARRMVVIGQLKERLKEMKAR